jgi:hypothetical protein
MVGQNVLRVNGQAELGSACTPAEARLDGIGRIPASRDGQARARDGAGKGMGHLDALACLFFKPRPTSGNSTTEWPHLHPPSRVWTPDGKLFFRRSCGRFNIQCTPLTPTPL